MKHRECGACRLATGSRCARLSGFPGASLTDSSALDDCDMLLSKPYRKHELAKAPEEILRPE